MKRIISFLLITTAIATGSAMATDSKDIQMPSTTAKSILSTQGTALVPRLSTEMMISGNSPTAQKMRDLLLNKPENPSLLKGKKIAIMTTDGVGEVELTIPLNHLKERGATVHIIAPKKPVYPEGIPVQVPDIRETHILTVRYMENGGWVKFDRMIDKVKSTDYDAVIVPGGAWNPDNLRMEKPALELLKAMYKEGKIVAAICHGPQVLINAGLLKGKKATSYWNVQQDIANAGAEVTDVPVVIDGNLITSRFPLDLPEFLSAIENALKS
jgi:protease I